MNSRVVIVGLDGMCPDVIRPWIDAGELPTFSRFVEDGCFGTLRSTVPTMTPPGWVTLTSGKNPGQHGIYGFTDPRDPESREIISAADVKDKRIWDIVGDNGGSSCVVNVPITYPPDKIEGVMVSGFLSPSGHAFTYPADIQRDLEEMGYVIDITAERGGFAEAVGQVLDTDAGKGSVPLDPGSPDSLYSKEIRILKKHIDALIMLCGRQEWDFAMYVTRGTDAIQHFYWDRKEVMLGFMREVDRQLARIIEELGSGDRPTHFLAVSDHGFSAAPGYRFNAGTWLVEEAYGRFSASGISTHADLKLSRAIYRWRHVKPVVMALATLRGLVGRGNRSRLVPWIGMVVEDEATRDRFIRSLASLRTPEGERAFSFVKTRDEIYSGRNLARAPEIVWLPSRNVLPTADQGEGLLTESRYPTPGAHWGSSNGLLMGLGPGFKTGEEVNGCMEDIAPTLYALLGIPIPSDLDGRPLEGMLVDPSPARDLGTGPPAIKGKMEGRPEDRGDSEIRDRLRALGYID